MEAGIYGQPLSKTATVQIPLVSGYTTGRLAVRLANNASGYPTSNPALNYDKVTMVYSNDGPLAATLQLYQIDDLASGLRTTLGSPIALVAGGMYTDVVTPLAHFVEFKCTANGPTQLRAQMTSQLDWTLQGFTKLDPTYPQSLVQGNYPPAFGALTNLTSPQIVNGS